MLEPNRKAFLVYSLAVLALWTVGLSLFPQAPPQQVTAMAAAWLAATAGAVAFRVRRDGRDWVAPLARRALPLAALVIGAGLAIWFGAPLAGPGVAKWAQGLVPGFLVALLMVGSGRMIFPLQSPRASR